jgi:cell division protein FtsB
MPDSDPLDVAQADAKRAVKRAGVLVVERTREWISAKLGVVVVGALASAAAAAYSLPIVAAVGCGVFAMLASISAVYAYRLLHRERTARHQAQIARLRARQRGLRHEAAALEAALALAGKPNERGGRLGFRGHSELLAAIRYAQSSRSYARRERLSSPPSEQSRAHQGPPPKPPNLAKSRQRLAVLDAEEKTIEAEIQALAAHAEKHERDMKLTRDEWRRVRDADREARKRVRQGQRPWPERPGMAIEVGTKRDGLPHARRLPPKATPEQIARGERPDKDEHRAA